MTTRIERTRYYLLTVAVGLLLSSSAMAHDSRAGFLSEPNSGRGQIVGISIGQISVPVASDVIVPVTITNTTGLGIIAYQFNITYDPAVLAINPIATVAEGTLSEEMVVTVNPNTPGILRVAVFGAYPLVGAGVLLDLRFTAIGPVGSMTAIAWHDVLVNEGDPGNVATDGNVSIAAGMPTTGVTISGNTRRVRGLSLPFARVELTGPDGVDRTLLANGQGYYEFANVEPGRSYTISVTDGPISIKTFTISVPDSTVDADHSAQRDASAHDVTLNRSSISAGNLSGRVLTAQGQGVADIHVTVTDSTGKSISTLSTSYGFYSFNQIPSGQTYVVSVEARRFVFNEQVIMVEGDVSDFDLVANP